MGLDMTIYKLQPTRAALVEEEKELQKKQTNLVTAHMDKNKDDIEKAIRTYIKDAKHIRKTTRTYDSIKRNVYQLIARYATKGTGNNFTDGIQWNLLNNCTAFSWGMSEKDRKEVTKDFINKFKKFCTLTNADDITRLYTLQESIDDQTEEIAYWRKYHKLNDYILEELTTPEGDGNCEELLLTKDNFISIGDFILEDSKDPYQIDDILTDWDDTCTYVYHPWW